jgi:hypothetical protein
METGIYRAFNPIKIKNVYKFNIAKSCEMFNWGDFMPLRFHLRLVVNNS